MQKVFGIIAFLGIIMLSCNRISEVAPLKSTETTSVDDKKDISNLKNEGDINIANMLAKDASFNLMLTRLDDLVSKQMSVKSSVAKKQLQHFGTQSSLTDLQYEEMSLLLGYAGKDDLLNDLKQLAFLTKELRNKYPVAMSDKNIIEIAVSDIMLARLATGSNGGIGGGGNCQGIYYACVGSAGVAAMIIVASCGPAAPFCVYGATVAAGAAMELCRQEYIGCD